MRGLPARNGTHIVIIGLLIQSIHALVGAVGFLLGEEGAKAAITLGSNLISRHTTVSAKALIDVGVLLLWLVIRASSWIVNRVEVADIAGHADILPPNVEQA